MEKINGLQVYIMAVLTTEFNRMFPNVEQRIFLSKNFISFTISVDDGENSICDDRIKFVVVVQSKPITFNS